MSKIHVTEVLCDDVFVRKNVDNMLLKKIVSTTTTNMTILKCYFKQIFQLKEAYFYELNLLHHAFKHMHVLFSNLMLKIEQDICI